MHQRSAFFFTAVLNNTGLSRTKAVLPFAPKGNDEESPKREHCATLPRRSTMIHIVPGSAMLGDAPLVKCGSGRVSCIYVGRPSHEHFSAAQIQLRINELSHLARVSLFTGGFTRITYEAHEVAFQVLMKTRLYVQVYDYLHYQSHTTYHKTLTGSRPTWAQRGPFSPEQKSVLGDSTCKSWSTWNLLDLACNRMHGLA